MKNCLLLFAVMGAITISAPAYSQYLFLDTNGDGKSSMNPYERDYVPADILYSTTTSIDVYFVTDKNPDGTAAVCGTGEPDFKINSYEFILTHSGYGGSVQYGAWTDNMGYSNGGVLCGDSTVCKGGNDVWVAMYKFTYDQPGKYKIGSLAVTVTGWPALDFTISTTLHPLAATSFGSNCSGTQGDHTIRLGEDFMNAYGNSAPIPVTNTTWGKIKMAYK